MSQFGNLNDPFELAKQQERSAEMNQIVQDMADRAGVSLDEPAAVAPLLALPANVLAYVAEVEARANAATPGPWTDDNGYRVRREDGEVVAETKHCEGSNGHDSTFIAPVRADALTLCAIVRAQHAELETPDGEISPKDKPCLTCAARLSQWDSIVAERDALRERLAKLESLGPWVEANRLAELDRANTWTGRPIDEAYVRGREDAFKQVGYELNNRAGKALRKEPTNELMG